jgi:N-acetylglutamate synthase
MIKPPELGPPALGPAELVPPELGPAQLNRTLLLAIERAGVLAWPAVETATLDGWLWRFANGGSQRANSVSTLDYTGSDIDKTIADMEQRYRARGARPLFQICDVSMPHDLDQRLQIRGYSSKDRCTTLIRPSPKADIEIGDGFEIFDRATDEWTACYTSVITADRRRTAPDILARVPHGAAFCGVRRGGRIVATALGVTHGGVTIAECVASLAEARGQGAASTVMRGLAAWGGKQGAHTIALQAIEHNAPAQAMYRALGYTLAGHYDIRGMAA